MGCFMPATLWLVRAVATATGIMLTAGVLHAEVWSSVPAFGFSTAIAIAAAWHAPQLPVVVVETIAVAASS